MLERIGRKWATDQEPLPQRTTPLLQKLQRFGGFDALCHHFEVQRAAQCLDGADS